MTPLEQLLAESPLDREAIDAFLEQHSFPMVDGRNVTFVFHGRADEVYLRHFIFGLPSSQPLLRAPDSDLWHLTIELPERSRVEYKFERVVGDQREWLMDPLNPHIARDPYGANSVAHGEGYRIPEWALPDTEARPGSIETHEVHSTAFGDTRLVDVYLPARFRRTRRYPLLVAHDGGDYLRYASLKNVLDNLTHRLEIRPMIVALTSSPNRLEEYAADPRHARFLVDELVPSLEARLPLIRRHSARALLGASFGAVAALQAAWSNPGFFGGLLLQSGSFAFADIGEHSRGPLFDPVAEFVNAFRAQPGRPADRMFVSCGVYESLIFENRSLYPILQSSAIDVRYVESRDGHNWENWRDRMRAGLSWLFPGPLWMVYE